MSIYAHIKRCLELTERDIVAAVEDRRTAKALLDQLAKVSKPGDGAPKLLLVFAKLAGPDIDWIDGGLRVEMIGDGTATVVEVLTELGLGMHERVFPSFKMNVPLEEFARAVERVPHMIAPLTLSGASNRRIVLAAIADEEEDGGGVVAPSAVSLEGESLYESVPRLHAAKEKTAAKAPVAPLQPRTASSPKHHAVRKVSKPGMEAVKAKGTGKSVRPPPPAAPPPGAPVPKMIIRAPLPRPPALPRTDEHTPAPGPSPLLAPRSAIAKVPLARIQVPRPAAEKAPESRPSKHPKRTSVKPPKGHSKPPERRSKTPPPRSSPPKAPRPGRAAGAAKDGPDDEAADAGWDETKE